MDLGHQQTLCSACREVIGDRGYRWYEHSHGLGFEALADGHIDRTHLVHDGCWGSWAAPAGYVLRAEYPDIRTREQRCDAAAARQSLVLRREGDGWTFDDLGAGRTIGTIESGGMRLPDGRLIPRAMPLAEVERFLAIDYSVS